MNRKIYHVTSVAGAWFVKLANARLPESVHKLKRTALSRAKRLAKRAKLGQVVVHGKSGRFQTEYTYGKDPRATVG